MSVGAYLRVGLIAFTLSAALILGLAGLFADSIRTHFVFHPRESSVEDAVRQVADREKALHAANGSFVTFSNADVEKNGSLLGLPWSIFPVKEFFFDATELDSGSIRLRALPRPDLVVALAIRARLYIAELSPKGELVHSGWYPSAD